MKINDTFHVSYCTNIHPGTDWETTFNSLKEFAPKIKEQVSPDHPFGLGLRLSNKASEELTETRMAQFKKWLDANGLYVFTMNGFPYGNFHGERVKDTVHAPDWTTPERLVYTKRLFEQLSVLLPSGMSGGISTSPISYKHWFSTTEATERAFESGAGHLAQIVLQLLDIETQKQQYLHLDIEPEPDGLLENSGEVVHFYNTYLLPIAAEVLKTERGIPEDAAHKLIKRYITLCYDICHFSLAFEEPEYTFQKMKDQGIAIGKIQVSAALKILHDTQNEDAIWEELARFDEPTYLHQVTEKVGDTVTTYNDLPMVLQEKKAFTELRAHFHVPIFLERFDALHSTQDHILKVLAYVREHPVSEHLEVETYTWEVLPKALKRELSASIVREIDWLKERL